MKQKLVFICKECGYKSPRWLGKCPECAAWNSFEESMETSSAKKVTSSFNLSVSPIHLRDISSEKQYRMVCGITELDRVLGGGIIPGSLILIGGDPGIGKSTLLLQMCGRLEPYKPLYVTGEESYQQIKYRASRIDGIPDTLLVLAETNAEAINAAISSSDSKVIVIDSIQSVYSDKVDATPGSINQIRECSNLFLQTAKKHDKAIFIVGHVNKDGAIAGPKLLEHLVDTVIQFEGEKTYSYRILRAIKNRFGASNEIGIFEMGEKGLIEVTNPSEIFLSGIKDNESGIAIAASIEGSRPILIEVQALVTHANYGNPQRTSNGFDMRRLQMILAVLEKRIGIPFSNNDVFVNVAGGVYLNDSSADLAIASALVSSFKDQAIGDKTVIIGEIGLTGEVRSVSAIESRLSEAQKLGFSNVILPAGNLAKLVKDYNLNFNGTERISLALAKLF